VSGLRRPTLKVFPFAGSRHQAYVLRSSRRVFRLGSLATASAAVTVLAAVRRYCTAALGFRTRGNNPRSCQARYDCAIEFVRRERSPRRSRSSSTMTLASISYTSHETTRAWTPCVSNPCSRNLLVGYPVVVSYLGYIRRLFAPRMRSNTLPSRLVTLAAAWDPCGVASRDVVLGYHHSPRGFRPAAILRPKEFGRNQRDLNYNWIEPNLRYHF